MQTSGPSGLAGGNRGRRSRAEINYWLLNVLGKGAQHSVLAMVPQHVGIRPMVPNAASY